MLNRRRQQTFSDPERLGVGSLRLLYSGLDRVQVLFDYFDYCDEEPNDPEYLVGFSLGLSPQSLASVLLKLHNLGLIKFYIRYYCGALPVNPSEAKRVLSLHVEAALSPKRDDSVEYLARNVRLLGYETTEAGHNYLFNIIKPERELYWDCLRASESADFFASRIYKCSSQVYVVRAKKKAVMENIVELLGKDKTLIYFPICGEPRHSPDEYLNSWTCTQLWVWEVAVGIPQRIELRHHIYRLAAEHWGADADPCRRVLEEPPSFLDGPGKGFEYILDCLTKEHIDLFQDCLVTKD